MLSQNKILPSVVLLTAVVLLGSGCAFGQFRRSVTKEEYREGLTKGLDAIDKRVNRGKQTPLEFSSNLFFAHEVMIEHVPTDVLLKVVDGFRDLGLHRVDINPGLFPWKDKKPEVIAKYDAVIRRIRDHGMKLVFNPQYSVVYHKVRSLEEWRDAALPVYAELARRYQPDIMVVAHEPTTMAKRMGADVSEREWAAFAREAAKVVKKESPRTRIGAGGLYTEFSYYEEFVELPEIEVLTLDIYNLAGFRRYNQMIQMAQKAGKPVYIEETWRPPHVESRGRRMSLEQISAVGIGDRFYEDLDVRWIESITRYAGVWGLEAVTPFWMQTFFRYAPDGDSSNVLDSKYNNRVSDAVHQGERTRTFLEYQKIIRQYGKSRGSVKR